MVEPDEFTACIQDDADRVAAHVPEPRPILHLAQPDACHSAHLGPFPLMQALPRVTVPQPDGLHLDEHQHLAVHRDDVELTEARLMVPADDAPTESLEVVARELLAAAPQ